MTLLPLLSSICDTVITHPNVANAACFQTLPKNTLYVEGYALDRFFEGAWSLFPVRQNAVGIIWDSGIPTEMEILHQNTIAAVKTVYGTQIVGLEKTTEPVKLRINKGDSGRSSGAIENAEVLLDAGQALIEQGANALAVCCLMPDCEDEQEDTAYKSGSGVDPIAGLEAMISHLLVAAFRIPAAHAPVFPYETALPVTDRLVDPRAASEFIVSTFLPCVLTGLSKAPQFTASHLGQAGIQIEDLSALIVPEDALGSIPVLSAVERKIPILTIQNNRTLMQATPAALGLKDQIIPCTNYQEALGQLIALKAGINWPEHF